MHVAGVAGGKPAAGPGHLSGVGSGGHHTGLLQHHGDDVLLAVDQEVHGDAHRELVGSDHILNHMIRHLGAQGAGRCQAANLLLGQAGELRYLGGPLLRGQLMETGILIRLHRKMLLSNIYYHQSVSTFIRMNAEPMDFPKVSSRREWVAPPPRACFMTKFMLWRVSTS